MGVAVDILQTVYQTELDKLRKQIYSCIKYELHDNFLRKIHLLSIAFSKILLIWQGVYDMECHVRIFFVHKYLRDILRFYTQCSDSCLIERITPIGIFRFAIKLDSRSCQRIRDAVALVRIRNCCNL